MPSSRCCSKHIPMILWVLREGVGHCTSKTLLFYTFPILHFLAFHKISVRCFFCHYLSICFYRFTTHTLKVFFFPKGALWHKWVLNLCFNSAYIKCYSFNHIYILKLVTEGNVDASFAWLYFIQQNSVNVFSGSFFFCGSIFWITVWSDFQNPLFTNL